MKRTFFISLVMVFMLSVSSLLFAQEEKEKPNFVTISTYKVRFDQIGKFLELWEKYTLPVVKEIDFIKSHRVFTHYWGPDWTVLLIMEYESFDAIDAAQGKMGELLKEKNPEEYQEINKKMRSLILGHTDAIVTEVKELRK
jgi:hypothetical protein